jgi:hypothetical protein
MFRSFPFLQIQVRQYQKLASAICHLEVEQQVTAKSHKKTDYHLLEFKYLRVTQKNQSIQQMMAAASMLTAPFKTDTPPSIGIKSCKSGKAFLISICKISDSENPPTINMAETLLDNLKILMVQIS